MISCIIDLVNLGFDFKKPRHGGYSYDYQEPLYYYNFNVKKYKECSNLKVCLVGTKEFDFYPYLSIYDSDDNIIFHMGVM